MTFSPIAAFDAPDRRSVTDATPNLIVSLPLLDLNLTLDDFPPELGRVDGTIAHAVERLFVVSCEIAGLKWMKISSDVGAESIAPFEISDFETLKELLNSDHWPTMVKSGRPIS